MRAGPGPLPQKGWMSRMSRTLYYNGTILTMEEPLYAEALLEEDGFIRAVGGFEELKAAAGAAGGLRMVNLEGRTLMPSFIDPHSHFTACANATMEADLGSASSFADIVRIVREFIKRENIPAGQWVKAGGYDHNRLAELAHPDRHVLDEAAPEHPLMIQHQSGHMGVFNTLGLKSLGVDANTEAPQGGMIAVENGEPTGYLEENAFVQYQKKVPMPAPEAFLKAYRKAQELYASYGITTVQEGMMNAQLGGLYQLMLRAGFLKLDLVAYMDLRDADKLMEQFPGHVKKYRHHMKLGGYKMFLDGSPQGRTAWLREPYLPEAGDGVAAGDGPAVGDGAAAGDGMAVGDGAAASDVADYRGYPTLTDDQVYANLKLAEEQDLQILAHCNGDGACEQYLRAYGKVMNDLPDHQPGDIRPVMVHAQLLGLDQIDQLKSLNVIPSFFVAHVYHWGEILVRNLGEERSSHISPAGSALKNGIRFTFHQDAPVIRPDMLETVWCAVNRRTRDGRLLGADERIPVLEALKAVTINGAYQYFEEDKKGSLAPGKLADLVVLDRNPLKVSEKEIRDIRVLATIKEGTEIYRAH